MKEPLVDVVAAAASLMRKPVLVKPAPDMGEPFIECPLGHTVAAGMKFCPECGLSVGEIVLEDRVDLEAVRTALKPADSLTREELAERQAEHLRVLAANQLAEQQVVDLAQQEDASENKVLIHFTEDGFTWGGRVWYRGDELEIGPQHPRWDSARVWIRMTKQEQYARYGRVMFDFGPWPGRQAQPGAERPLATAPASRWAHEERSFPASAGDIPGSLVPH